MAKTGHATLESLLDYVDAAFRKKSKYEQIIRNVDMARAYESFEKRRKRLLEDFKKGKLTKEDYIEREEALSSAMDRALEAA